ncbi:MAG: hypothetical protein JST69_11525 [Bacteroidetes bacterium]|nr:hypothetical protein [Bacteroidota bacterium]
MVIYEDHRYLLNALFFARQKFGDFPLEGLSLICFDRHSDGNNIELSRSIRSMRNRILHGQEITQKKSWEFVEFSLSPNDDDWLKAGMELGLINHVVCIGNTEDVIFDRPEDVYIDHLDVHHKIYSFDDFSVLLDNNAQQNIRELCSSSKVILDFDLDCFVYAEDNHRPFKEEDFSNQLRRFIRDVIDEAEFVSIARESEYCGGFSKSNEILELLDRLFFEGRLSHD